MDWLPLPHPDRKTRWVLLDKLGAVGQVPGRRRLGNCLLGKGVRARLRGFLPHRQEDPFLI